MRLVKRKRLKVGVQVDVRRALAGEVAAADVENMSESGHESESSEDGSAGGRSNADPEAEVRVAEAMRLEEERRKRRAVRARLIAEREPPVVVVVLLLPASPGAFSPPLWRRGSLRRRRSSDYLSLLGVGRFRDHHLGGESWGRRRLTRETGWCAPQSASGGSGARPGSLLSLGI